MAAEDSKDKLLTLLKNNKLHDDIVKMMVDTIGMDSVSDFASYFSKDSYEAGVAAKIVDQTSQKGNDLIVGRLKTAWRLAAAELLRRTITGAAGRAR